MKHKKSRKVIGKITESFIKKHDLHTSFTLLHKNTKDKLEGFCFPEQIKRIGDGFYRFQSSRKVGLFPIKKIEISEFYGFLWILNHVLSNCKNEEDKLHLINQFKCKVKNSTDQLRGFYYELKILSKLLKDGLCIEKLPEADTKNHQDGFSQPDAIMSKNGKLLQVECKTVSHNIGHPIIEEAGKKFLDILSKNEIYNDICPLNHYCHVQFTFDKPLMNSQPKNGNKDIYTPLTLLDQFKLDYSNKDKNLKINISKNDDTMPKFLTDDYSLSRAFQCRYLPIGSPKIYHQITLISQAPNTFFDKIQCTIDKAVTTNRQGKEPLIFCLELYDFLDDNQFKTDMAQFFFHKYSEQLLWVIISDRADKEHIRCQEDHCYGRNPLEFRTKSMTDFLR
jgi:hypothetical protein